MNLRKEEINMTALTGTKADLKNKLREAGFTKITVDKKTVKLDKAKTRQLISFAEAKHII